MITKMTWKAIDLSTNKEVKMPPGEYEMERKIPPEKSAPWLLFKGTTIGKPERFWKHFIDSPNEINITLRETK